MTNRPRKPDPLKIRDAVPNGAPLYRIARDVLRAVGTWNLRVYAEAARKAIDPMDPFMAAQNMAAQFIPYLNAYVDQGGREIRAEMGLQDANEWTVNNPFAINQARIATLDLCQETVDNFVDALNREILSVREEERAALADQIRDAIRRDVAESITHGETSGETVNRVARWLNDESRWRARRIAVTESARAYNAGQMASTAELDFVAGYELVLSSDACPLCHAIKRMCPKIPKGGSFGENGKNPTYKNLRFAPFHPGCRCTTVPIFDDEVPAEWPKPVMPVQGSAYIKPSDQDIIDAVEGGYESVQIGNAKSVGGFVALWEAGEWSIRSAT